MSAQMDYMTQEMMLEVALRDGALTEVREHITERQYATYLFNVAHTMELTALKEQAEAALEAKYDEMMENE
jgi:hypothetical protein